MEETTREREERLKGWSTFLEGSNQGQQNNTAKPAEGAATTEPTEPSSTTEPKQHPETETEPQPQPQPQQQQQKEEAQEEEEEGADSTDSSLAGSDVEEA